MKDDFQSCHWGKHLAWILSCDLQGANITPILQMIKLRFKGAKLDYGEEVTKLGLERRHE